MDLSSVPEDHFAALTSKVRKVKIQNVISPKLEALRCSFFEINDQVFNTEETLALKKCMQFLEVLVLGAEGNVFLDIHALTEFEGKGCIYNVTLFNATARRYRFEMNTWAKRIKWGVLGRTQSSIIGIYKQDIDSVSHTVQPAQVRTGFPH